MSHVLCLSPDILQVDCPVATNKVNIFGIVFVYRLRIVVPLVFTVVNTWEVMGNKWDRKVL